MPQTRSSSTRKVIKGMTLDVRFGADIIDIIDIDSVGSENLTRIVGPARSWIDRLVGLFDNSPLNGEVLQYEREARERLDAKFVMPE